MMTNEGIFKLQLTLQKLLARKSFCFSVFSIYIFYNFSKFQILAVLSAISEHCKEQVRVLLCCHGRRSIISCEQCECKMGLEAGIMLDASIVFSCSNTANPQTGIRLHTIYPLFFFSSFPSRPHAYESANGLYSMEPRSHKCSVMGHKRRNFNQSQKHGDFICHNNFFTQVTRTILEDFVLLKTFWGASCTLTMKPFLMQTSYHQKETTKWTRKLHNKRQRRVSPVC